MKHNKDVIENSNQSPIIYYVDGLCGSGKTFGLGRYIQQSRLHQKIIITTPSKALADQIHTQLNGLGISNCHKIYSSDDRSANVPAQVMAAIKIINGFGQGVIICTQQVFPNIHFIENREEWVLVVDEIPKVDQFDAPALPYNHGLISQYINITETVGTGLYAIEGNTDIAIMGGNVDSINEIIRPIIEDIYSERYRCYTDKTNWDRLVEQHQVSDDTVHDKGYGNDFNKLFFLRLLQPSIYQGFAQVIMMGANFQHSLLYRYWSDYCDVLFKPFTPIKQQLRYSQYSNGQRLTIRYLQEADWSKYTASKMVQGKTQLEWFAEKISGFMGDQPFIYMTNNTDSTEFANGIKAPVISHGINQFSHIHHIYFSPALNNQPKHTAMLIDLGFDAVFIKRSMSYEIAHQAIMRTSLRNPAIDTPVTAVVVDKATAEAIARLFPECQIGPMDGVIKKVMALSQLEKKNKARLAKLIELKALNSVVTGTASAATHHRIDEMMSEEKLSTIFPYIEFSGQNLPKPGDFLDLSLGVSFLSSIYNKSLAQIDSSPMEFVKTMQSIHANHIIRTKDESILFNGVTYKTEQSRALDNVELASLVVVDIDDGDLSPEEFHRIFTQEHKHSFFMCNSFSRSTQKPNNYRAVFFINQVVNDEIYRDVQAYLQRIIHQYGYITCWPKDREIQLAKNPKAQFSGIDLSKTHTASFFYIPCKVQDRLEWSFFWRGNLKDVAQLKRYAIDVEKVIQYAPATTELAKLVYESPVKVAWDNPNDPRYTPEAIKTYIKQGNFKHLGRHQIYGHMAAAMNQAGFTETDFIELTPYISQSKTTKDASKTWRSWQKYQRIKRGTLYHLLGIKKAL